MDLNKEQYQELVEKLAEELVFGDMEKTAGIKGVATAYRDVASGKGVRKAEEVHKWAKKKVHEDGVTDENLDALAGSIKSVDREKKKQFAAITVPAAAGAGAAGFGAKKINDHVKEASDALIEAILYKQAALNEKEEAMLVAEASEKALNTLGYSMFAEQ